jgi:hypothetical protein
VLSDNKIDEMQGFYSFLYENSFQPSNITFKSITTVPSNADVTAIYTFEIKIERPLPKGAVIDIIFPNQNYKTLPTSPKCNITGGIKYFTSCILTGTTIRMTTAEKQDP